MPFLFVNKILRLNDLKTRTAMSAKISMLVICVEAIIDLLLYNLHYCTFKNKVKLGLCSVRNENIYHKSREMLFKNNVQTNYKLQTNLRSISNLL